MSWFQKSPGFEKSLFSRRAALTTLVSAPAIVSSAQPLFAETPAAPAVALAGACILTPAAISGPYYFDPKLERSDIAEGHPGAPLRLRFIVMNAADCTPLSGARIDVWHARADGYYSGYPRQGDRHNVDTSGDTFMRGTQIADARGEALFHTVYPGWYEGRTVHVHFKIFVDDTNMLTGQMYFPDALSQYVFANVGAYRRKVVRKIFNTDDELALQDTTHGGYCDIKEEADHYRATLVVGVSRTAVTALNHAAKPKLQPRAIVPGVAAEKQNNS